MSKVLLNNTEQIIFCDSLYKAYDFLESTGLTEEHLFFHHIASAQGYLKRNQKKPEQEEVMITKYSGKFGEGYILYLPNYLTKRFVHKLYFTRTTEHVNELFNALAKERAGLLL